MPLNQDELLEECRKWYQHEEIGNKILESSNTKLFKQFIEQLPDNFNKPGVFTSCCSIIYSFLYGDSPLDKLSTKELSNKVDELHQTTKLLKRQMKNLCLDVFIPMIYGDIVNEAFGNTVTSKNDYDSQVYSEFFRLSKLLSVIDFMGQSIKDTYRPPTQRKTKNETILSRSLVDWFYSISKSPKYSLIAELVSLFCNEVTKQDVVDMVSPTLKTLKSNENKSKSEGEYTGIVFGIENETQMFNFVNRDYNILRLTKSYIQHGKIYREKDVFRHSGLKIYESE